MNEEFENYLNKIPVPEFTAFKKEYLYVAGHIDKPGSFLDIYCKNGILLYCLKYFWSEYSIQPFGFNASREILNFFPEYKNNFFEKGLDSIDELLNVKFDYILLDLKNMDKNFDNYILKKINFFTHYKIFLIIHNLDRLLDIKSIFPNFNIYSNPLYENNQLIEIKKT